MSQLAKVLQVLDLFSEQRTTLSAEEIAALMNIPRTTTFRYLRQLTDAGLLTKLSTRYALGARIIQLDYQIRRCDPLLLSSLEVMKSLAGGTTCSVLLSSLYGEEVINVHHEAGQDRTAISFGRGRPLPLFRGASSRIILAHLPLAKLKRLYAKYSQHPDVRELGQSFDQMASAYREHRRRGHYISHGEVDIGVTGIAAPIFNAEDHVVGSLALVFESRREPLFNEDTLAAIVRDGADEVTVRLKASTAEPAAPSAADLPALPSENAARKRRLKTS